jgi:urease accessory protein
MLRATEALAPDAWTGPAADRVTLDSAARRRRRIAMTGEGGLRFLLDLAATPRLRDGAALRLEDGRLVEVRAAPEALVEARAESPLHLLRLAWHLGNRHLEAELSEDRLRFRPDPVIERMLVGLGARLAPVHAPFEPESGAYGHAHHQGHDPSHAHAHATAHAEAQARAHAAPHADARTAGEE